MQLQDNPSISPVPRYHPHSRMHVAALDTSGFSCLCIKAFLFPSQFSFWINIQIKAQSSCFFFTSLPQSHNWDFLFLSFWTVHKALAAVIVSLMMYSFMGGGLFCAIVGNILLVVSTATDYWMQYRLSGSFAHQGLWRYCMSGKCYMQTDSIGKWWNTFLEIPQILQDNMSECNYDYIPLLL